MIGPRMATMLGFLLTDAPVWANDLQQILAEAVEHSFNCLSVEGHASTNDTVLLLSSTAATEPILQGDDVAAFAGMVRSPANARPHDRRRRRRGDPLHHDRRRGLCDLEEPAPSPGPSPTARSSRPPSMVPTQLGPDRLRGRIFRRGVRGARSLPLDQHGRRLPEWMPGPLTPLAFRIRSNPNEMFTSA